MTLSFVQLEFDCGMNTSDINHLKELASGSTLLFLKIPITIFPKCNTFSFILPESRSLDVFLLMNNLRKRIGTELTDLPQVVPIRPIQAVRKKLLRACCHQLVNNLLRAHNIRFVETNLSRVCWPHQPCYKMITTCSRLWHLKTEFWHLKTEFWHLKTEFWHLKTEFWHLKTEFWYLKTEFWH